MLLLPGIDVNPISLQYNHTANNYLRDEKSLTLSIRHKDENEAFLSTEKKKALRISQILVQVRSAQRTLNQGKTHAHCHIISWEAAPSCTET